MNCVVSANDKSQVIITMNCFDNDDKRTCYSKYVNNQTENGLEWKFQLVARGNIANEWDRIINTICKDLIKKNNVDFTMDLKKFYGICDFHSFDLSPGGVSVLSKLQTSPR